MRTLLLIGLLYATAATNINANAGDFIIVNDDYAVLEVWYGGTVLPKDIARWQYIAKRANGRVIKLTINSGGGSAYAGIELYWLMERYPRLQTVAGKAYGAWSAAAVMWLAGDIRTIEPGGGQVFFHAAYCDWDPEPPVDIGCDTSVIQMFFADVWEDAGLDGLRFNEWLDVVQTKMGTDGWIGITETGWHLYCSTSDLSLPFTPTEFGGGHVVSY
tara:strand:- start:195 stop:842 length:648 start_codon:yes stop_codon:yes gene_type:complete